jgi:hypothetical protein
MRRLAFSPSSPAQLEETYDILSGTKGDHGATGTGPVSYGPGPVFQPGRFLFDFDHYSLPP